MDLLGKINRVELVGLAKTSEDVLDAVDRLRPQLLFLKVEMPRLDGFDIASAVVRRGDLVGTHNPLVCFIAAEPQLAFAAFEAGIFDFLCRPVRLPRLEKAIERARLALERRDAAVRLRLMSKVVEQVQRARAVEERQFLWVAQRGEMIRVNVMTLDWIQAEAEYVRLHTAAKSFLLRASITSIHRKLEDLGFVRIHRSAVVNAKSVASIRKSRNSASVVLKSGFELPVGRKFRSMLQLLAQS